MSMKVIALYRTTQLQCSVQNSRSVQYLFEVVAEDGAKDESHGFVIKLTDAYMMEVASKTRCDEAAASTRRAHCRHKLAVHHLAESVSTVIPAQQITQF
jgi:hypothetical protein